ncbi:MAG: PRTRC system ThiF family protein [Natronospirillum sp.]|uniref:PRTRC system ThiF family protein n=1 Tax=Natronospirillum sp. TaxID=2812955 RepID=UPI0026010286|nr:PRTRC system ThiF family protein [Natronospirillum sp.]MCH8552512.1 PRTRC system ThiF family protein [Natronospirillum sp.]
MGEKLYFGGDLSAREPVQIILVGAGGTGSEMLARLVKMHFRLTALDMPGLHVTVLDPDVVSEANVGQQNFWPSDVGLPKAQLLVERYNCAAGLGWGYGNCAFSPDILGEHQINGPAGGAILITCTDSPELRWEIGQFDLGSMLWIDSGNDRASGQVVLGHTGDVHAQYVPNVADLYPGLETTFKVEGDSCSAADSLRKQAYGINEAMAASVGRMVWELVYNSCIDYHMTLINLADDIVEQKLPIDPEQWAIMGFSRSQAQGVAA